MAVDVRWRVATTWTMQQLQTFQTSIIFLLVMALVNNQWSYRSNISKFHSFRYAVLENRASIVRASSTEHCRERRYKTKACLSLVANITAAVQFQLWVNECDGTSQATLSARRVGYSPTAETPLALRAGKRRKMENVGEFNMVFVETPNMSEIYWVLNMTHSKKYVKESVLSPYSLSFHQTVDMDTSRKHFQGTIWVIVFLFSRIDGIFFIYLWVYKSVRVHFD